METATVLTTLLLFVATAGTDVKPPYGSQDTSARTLSMRATSFTHLYCPFSTDSDTNWYKIGGNCYLEILLYYNWKDAEAYCQYFDGHLVSYANKKERSRVINTLYCYDWYWTGLRDTTGKGDFNYSDGSGTGYIDWASNEPEANASCAADKDEEGFVTFNCHNHKRFICKSSPSTTQKKGQPDPPQDMSEKCYPQGPGSVVQWYKNPDNNYCYSVSTSTVSWNEAYQKCISYDSDLTSIHSGDETGFLIDEISAYDHSSNAYWIGLTRFVDETLHQWTDGTTFNYWNWADGQPDDMNGEESCVRMDTKNGLWSDEHCGSKNKFVCKRFQNASGPPTVPPPTPGNCPKGWIQMGISKCFKFEGFVDDPSKTVRQTWKDARQMCQRMAVGSKSGELASIHSPGEQNFLINVMQAAGMAETIWIGLHNIDEADTYDPNFEWSDETRFNFNNLIHNAYEYGDCVTMDNDGAWDRYDCTYVQGFLCAVAADPEEKSRPPSPFKNCSEPYQSFYIYDSSNCFSVQTSNQNFQGAVDKCRQMGGELASIMNEKINTFVDGLAAEKGSTSVWIGLSRENNDTVKWVNGWNAYYTQWGSHGLTEASAAENCAAMTVMNSTWDMDECNIKKPFVCFISSDTPPTLEPVDDKACPDNKWLDVGGPKCYQVFNNKVKMFEANNRCLMKQGSYVVGIHSEEENDVITKMLIQLSDSPWIGLVRTQGAYVWSDHQGLDYDNWAPGEPDKSGSSNKECVVMSLDDGTWMPYECYLDLPYICAVDKVPKKPSPAPPERKSSGLTGGAVAGIVIVVLLVVAGAVLGSLYYTRSTRRPNPHLVFSFSHQEKKSENDATFS